MSEPVSKGLVQGFLHCPAGKIKGGFVLAHGAGSDCRSRLMTALATACSELGFAALRIDLPFRQGRKSGPPHPSLATRDRQGLHEAAEFVRQFGERIFLCGHSYGGRQATIAAASEDKLCDVLLLFSYPLHPPRKSENLRTSHFPQLQTPAMFVHGSHDPFGTPEEMQSALALIPGKTALRIVDRAGHELKPVVANAVSYIQTFIDWMDAGRSAT